MTMAAAATVVPVIALLVFAAFSVGSIARPRRLTRLYAYALPIALKTPLPFVGIGAYTSDLPSILLVGVLGLALGAHVRATWRRFSVQNTLGWLAVISYAVAVSTVFVFEGSSDPWRAVVQTARFALSFALIPLIAMAIEKRLLQPDDILKPLITTVCVLAVLGLLGFAAANLIHVDLFPLVLRDAASGVVQTRDLPVEVAGLSLTRANVFMEPKGLASWMVLGLILWVGRRLDDRRQHGNAIWPVALFLAMIATFSRTGLFTLIVAGLVLLVFAFRSRPTIKYAVPISAILAIVTMLAIPLGTAALESFAQPGQPPWLASLEEYDAALVGYWLQTPAAAAIGTGIAYAEENSAPYLPSYAHWTIGADFTVRRGFIYLLVMTGIPGTIIVVTLLARVARRLVNLAHPGLAFIAVAGLGVFLIDMAGGLLGAHAAVWGCLAGVAAVGDRQRTKTTSVDAWAGSRDKTVGDPY